MNAQMGLHPLRLFLSALTRAAAQNAKISAALPIMHLNNMICSWRVVKVNQQSLGRAPIRKSHGYVFRMDRYGWCVLIASSSSQPTRPSFWNILPLCMAELLLLLAEGWEVIPNISTCCTQGRLKIITHDLQNVCSSFS
mmetsp:Transcript_40925/g.95075  ORF Transcript_40925/g.95075 Transcript_40925/m.95075 type:complete len:139 (+) Transcript_40925:78-494(+)